MRPLFRACRENTFLRFSFVGSIGFVVDAGLLTLLLYEAGMDPYSGRLVSFLCAASTTWMLNRTFTFQRAVRSGRTSRQWTVYVLLMTIGGAVNYSVYALGVSTVPVVRVYPILGVAAGALCGLACNYSTSRSLFLGRLSGLVSRSTTRVNG